MEQVSFTFWYDQQEEAQEQQQGEQHPQGQLRRRSLKMMVRARHSRWPTQSGSSRERCQDNQENDYQENTKRRLPRELLKISLPDMKKHKNTKIHEKHEKLQKEQNQLNEKT